MQKDTNLLHIWTKGGPVYRVDVNADGKKIGDYSIDMNYYSLGDEYKAEINWRVPITFTVKDKTFNKVIFQETNATEVANFYRALDSEIARTKRIVAATRAANEKSSAQTAERKHSFLQQIINRFSSIATKQY